MGINKALMLDTTEFFFAIVLYVQERKEQKANDGMR